MIIRLRSRDGLEKVQIGDGASVSALKQVIQQQLGVPVEQQRLSTDAALLLAKQNGSSASLLPDGATLASQGIAHGAQLYLAYDMEREVAPVYRPGPLDSGRPFGSAVTVADIVAKQRRIERQDKPTVEGVSFEHSAADSFQAYCQSALAFSIKRGGILYGTVGEDNIVRVEFIYEPPQQGSATDLVLERHTEQEAKCDFLASALGLSKVGWVFSQADRDKDKEADYILSSSEIQAMAGMQDELGPKAVTVLVTWVDGQVHFEAFQCSEQAVQLYKDGWFAPEETPSGVSRMVNPKEPDLKEPIIVASKDTGEVDNDWFLCPMRISHHQGELLRTAFPVENRLVPQNMGALRDALRKNAPSQPYSARIADPHLLLWLAGQLDPSDMAAIAASVKERSELMEGYRVIIDSIAGF